MTQRFFVASPITADRATLTGSEAHHLQHVMRAGVGDVITLFDGSGREYRGCIDRLERSQVSVVVTGVSEISREAFREVIVGVALPKGDRQRWLIEKLTELGAARVVPLRSERSIVQPDANGLDKLRRFVMEASKQCGRNRLMEISPPVRLPDFLTSAPAAAVRWFADPPGVPPGDIRAVQASAYLAVGPEGGFSSQERCVARETGWQSVSLGPRTLRIETACVVLTTLASGDLQGE